MNFAAVVGLCSVWATPFLRNNLQRHKRNQSAGDPLIEGETLFRVGHPPLHGLKKPRSDEDRHMGTAKFPAKGGTNGSKVDVV
jgi:hypothetical protein